MSNTINLSLSQPSNHLISHFENFHNDVLIRKGFSTDTLRHLTIKKQSPSSNLVNYYPRSVLIDYSNGTGALNKHLFFDLNFETPEIPKIETSVQPKDPNNYQLGLNKGEDSNNLVLDRCEFWSDFSNVIHKPNTIHTLSSYVYDSEADEGVHKDFPDQLFNGFQLGQNEFAHMRDEIEDSIRLQFEDADSVDKVNIVVDLDSAWSGFALGVLNDLIDFQLNGHCNRIVYWGLMKQVLESPKDKYHRVKSLLDIQELVGCYMGLELKKHDIWKSTAMMSLPFFQINQYKIDDIQTLTKNGEFKYINNIQVSTKSLSPNFFSCESPMRGRINKLSSIEYTCSANVNLPTLPDEVHELNGSAIKFQVDDSLRSQWGSMSQFIKSATRGDVRGEYLEQLGSLKERYSFGYENYSSDEDEEDGGYY